MKLVHKYPEKLAFNIYQTGRKAFMSLFERKTGLDIYEIIESPFSYGFEIWINYEKLDGKQRSVIKKMDYLIVN